MGVCLDLLDTANTSLLREWYSEFRKFARQNSLPMPLNRQAPGTRPGDRVLRFRDCAVLKYTMDRIAETRGIQYQSVRGVFVEGEPAFPGAKIALKSHIQVAIKDPTCILSVYLPDQADYDAGG